MPMLVIDESRSLQIFDLGNVLVDVDVRKTMAAFEALGMAHIDAQLSNSHAQGGIFSLYCDGHVSTPDFIAGVRTACGFSQATDAQIADAWNAMIGQFRPEAIRAVADLKNRGFRTALLSNCNALHTDHCRSIFPGPGALDDLFDAVFFSQEIHASKPNLSTWQTVLDHFGAQPAEAAFYDDSAINVKAAADMGIAAYVV